MDVETTHCPDRWPTRPGEYQWRVCTSYDGKQPKTLSPCLADEEPTHLMMVMPNNSGYAQLALKGSGEQSNGASWEWNGDKEKPTLKPSIDGSSHGGWHGFLTNGVLKSV